MQIIPVLDLLGGQAVLARRGERHLYRPLGTALCPSPDPRAVIETYLALFPFRKIYIADLDGIAGRDLNATLLQVLAAAFPAVCFWIDRGAMPAPVPGAVMVAGTESGPPPAGASVLSLDFDDDVLRGDTSILSTPECWPEDVIVMCLRHIGSGRGPDLERAQRLRALAPDRHYYLGGGVRSRADLDAARAAGLDGALVATALHDLTLDRATLDELGDT